MCTVLGILMPPLMDKLMRLPAHVDLMLSARVMYWTAIRISSLFVFLYVIYRLLPGFGHFISFLSYARSSGSVAS